MNTKDLTEKSNEQLLEQIKSVKGIIGLLAGMLLILFCAGLFLFFKNGFDIFLIIPVTLLPIILLNVRTLKEIKKELNTRENKAKSY